MDELMQIGAVAERVGLSLRTIRHYEDVGLVTPAERSPGGFRLYSEANVVQLKLIKQMKPLDFSLEQMRDLLSTLDDLEHLDAANGLDATDPESRRHQLEERVALYRAVVDARVDTLREQLHRAEDFAAFLRVPTRSRPRR